MDDLKLMTVRALRELARKHLGHGYSRLKTKAELMAALARKLAEGSSEPEPEAKAVAPEPEPAAPPIPAAPAEAPLVARVDPSEVPEALREEPEIPEQIEGEPEPLIAEVPVAALAVALPEGEALVVVEPAPRVISAAEQALLDEHLGELPASYGDDAVALFDRDPHTLWIFWDFAEQTARAAREGLHGAHAVLRLFDGPTLIREVDIALESRAWYLHNVAPGRHYHAEIDFIDERGQARRVGRPSNDIGVPGEGPSPLVDDRFVSIPAEVPMQRATEVLTHAHPGEPFAPEAQQALMTLGEEGLRHEGVREPGEREVEVRERIHGLGGGSDRWQVVRSRFGGHWTSSRPS